MDFVVATVEIGFKMGHGSCRDEVLKKEEDNGFTSFEKIVGRCRESEEIDQLGFMKRNGALEEWKVKSFVAMRIWES